MDMPTLSRDSILLSVARTDAFTDRHYQGFYHWLDADEKMRLARFRFESNRREYLLAHATTRWMLARCLAEDNPSRIRILQGDYGKPYLAESRGLAFNLSHGAGAVLCAVAYAESVGADIEELERSCSMSNVFASAFTLSEQQVLSRMTEAKAQRISLRWWTIKESFLKADGRGLGLSPTAICCATDAIDELGRLNFVWNHLAYERSVAYQGEVRCSWGSHWISWTVLGQENTLRPDYIECLGYDDGTFLTVSEPWRFSGICGHTEDRPSEMIQPAW